MKFTLFKITLASAVLLTITHCSTSKKDTKNQHKQVAKPVAVVHQDTPYEPKAPEEKTNFFKTTDHETKWVDSIYNKLSLREKIGQLYMVSAYSNQGEKHEKEISDLITDYKVGSLIFFQGGPMRQAKLTNKYQAKSEVPLLVAIDGEWGLSMRLDSTYAYPFNMTLGAIQDLKLIEKMGQYMGEENKRIGLHFNFAPVLDINTNPNNPIIGNRSFGEDKLNVAQKASALMRGYQSQNVLSNGKHFPGHGDTATDSHKALPLVDFTTERLDQVELYPYKQLFDEGLASVMVAHLEIPSLDNRPNHPTSASYNVVTTLLQEKLGFKGLIITDGLNMKGAADFLPAGELELAMVLAGNDILLCPENIPVGFAKLEAAYNDGILTEFRLAKSVKKILRYKYQVGLNKYKPIDTSNLLADLNPAKSDALQYELYENAITVIKNNKNILPIRDLSQKIAYVKLGDDFNSDFVAKLKSYTNVTEVTAATIEELKNKLKDFDTVIIGFHKINKAWNKNDFTETELQWLQQIAKQNKVILDVFARPYTLMPIKDFSDIDAIVMSYQNTNISQTVSAEIIFGSVGAKGKLPVTINTEFKVNEGIETQKLNRLAFSTPENVGMNSAILSKIDDVAQKAIAGKMAPSMQVLVARKGKVIFQKAYGTPTYESTQKVTNSDLYDVASISKMIATLPNVMQLYDRNKVTLESKLGDLLPYFAKTNKADITFKELLSHYAGLQSWIPYYKKTIDKNNQPLEQYYSKVPTSKFSKQVADNLYIRNDYHDTIMKIIADSPLLSKKEYVYSDLTFIILKEILEHQNKSKIDKLTAKQFYNSMGMNYTLYNPLQKFTKNQIAPTEVDTYFRQQTVHGYVHDMAAAMEGGIAGHAGIFSNAMDVAKMMQLFLQKGAYGDKRYFSEKTFNDFNTLYYKDHNVHRGLGFDKRIGKDGNTCGCVSEESYGHTGFTGNIAWVDPKTEIVYVFLSNRTYPGTEGSENKLAKNRIREQIQQLIQDAIIK